LKSNGKRNSCVAYFNDKFPNNHEELEKGFRKALVKFLRLIMLKDNNSTQNNLNAVYHQKRTKLCFKLKLFCRPNNKMY
jgi:hypothetical protein